MVMCCQLPELLSDGQERLVVDFGPKKWMLPELLSDGQQRLVVDLYPN